MRIIKRLNFYKILNLLYLMNKIFAESFEEAAREKLFEIFYYNKNK